MIWFFFNWKNGNTFCLANLRNLCDPYEENDRDVKFICYAEMLQKKERQELINMFKNGRIIGGIKINEDKAVVEFAYGLSSNSLEKMVMIKRNDLWYLSSM